MKLAYSTRWDSLFAYYDLDTNQTDITVVSPALGPRSDSTLRQTWDPASSAYLPSTVDWVPRQGAFDNIHITPAMDYNGNVAYMAPICQHDCLHIHWRWGAAYSDKPLLGWAGGRPFQQRGAPLIPENQTLRISANGPILTYMPSVENVPAQAWQIFMHHGTGYVSG
jgi:hypothetical protein